MSIKKLLLFSLIVAVQVASLNAQAGTTFSIFGVGDFSSFSYSVPRANLSNTTKLGVGAGAQLEFKLIERKGIVLSLETGALYLQRQLYLSDSSVPIRYQINAPGVQIPIQLRAWYLSFLNVGFGAYYNMGLGNVTVSESSNAGSVPNGTYSYSSRGLKKSEFGFIGGLGLNLPLKVFSVFLDTRIAMGLSDINDPAISGLTTKIQSFQAMLGLRFGKLR